MIKKLLLGLLLALSLPAALAAPTITFVGDTTTYMPHTEGGIYVGTDDLRNTSHILADMTDTRSGTTCASVIPGCTWRLGLMIIKTQLNTTVPTGTDITNMSNSLALARTGGVGIIVRFLSTGATAAQMVAQMQALAPMLKAYQDVIYLLQAGFCGSPDGEWVGPEPCTTSGSDKTTLKNALFAMRPPSVPLAFTAVNAYETWFGLNPLKQGVPGGAFSGSQMSYAGFHTDCILTQQGESSFYAGAVNYGGFASTTTEAQKRAYVRAWARFVPYGGEVCSTSQGALVGMITDCPSLVAYGPQYQLAYMGFFGQPFWNSWTTGGCLNTMMALMGPRYRLVDATYVTTVARGGVWTVLVNINNDGWSTLFSQRRPHVTLDNGAGSVIDCPAAATQLREILPGAPKPTAVRFNCAVPSGAPTNAHTIYFDMRSNWSTLQNADHALRPGNANSGSQVWDGTKARFSFGTSVTPF